MFEQYQDIMTVAEVSEALGVGKGTVYELLQAGKLAGFRMGRMWKTPRESVELYVRNCAGIKK